MSHSPCSLTRYNNRIPQVCLEYRLARTRLEWFICCLPYRFHQFYAVQDLRTYVITYVLQIRSSWRSAASDRHISMRKNKNTKELWIKMYYIEKVQQSWMTYEHLFKFSRWNLTWIKWGKCTDAWTLNISESYLNLLFEFAYCILSVEFDSRRFGKLGRMYWNKWT